MISKRNCGLRSRTSKVRAGQVSERARRSEATARRLIFRGSSHPFGLPVFCECFNPLNEQLIFGLFRMDGSEPGIFQSFLFLALREPASGCPEISIGAAPVFLREAPGFRCPDQSFDHVWEILDGFPIFGFTVKRFRGGNELVLEQFDSAVEFIDAGEKFGTGVERRKLFCLFESLCGCWEIFLVGGNFSSEQSCVGVMMRGGAGAGICHQLFKMFQSLLRLLLPMSENSFEQDHIGQGLSGARQLHFRFPEQFFRAFEIARIHQSQSEIVSRVPDFHGIIKKVAPLQSLLVNGNGGGGPVSLKRSRTSLI